MAKRTATPKRPPVDPAGYRYGVQSTIIDCVGKGADKNRCIIDWDDPDEYDEMYNEAEQCVNFVCERCGEYVLCSTWRRQRLPGED